MISVGVQTGIGSKSLPVYTENFTVTVPLLKLKNGAVENGTIILNGLGDEKFQ